jgi:hypothetical protein
MGVFVAAIDCHVGILYFLMWSVIRNRGTKVSGLSIVEMGSSSLVDGESTNHHRIETNQLVQARKWRS